MILDRSVEKRSIVNLSHFLSRFLASFDVSKIIEEKIKKSILFKLDTYVDDQAEL